MATLRYGDRIGPYVINGFAGTGATSYVYRARRIDNFDSVAIKVLHPHLVADPINRLKFYREARVMMRMNHPNVVRFNEILESEGSLAFVMEFVDGFTLEEWREHHGEEIDEMTLACVFVDILRGLASAHRQGVVHRDLKPANVLITHVEGRYVAKIIDFGVARFVAEPMTDHERSKIVGTAAYISPEEVCDPELVCAASDLYSIGVMLYEAACGKRPFDNMAVQDLMQAHAAVDPQRPSHVNPSLSPAMESVIMRTLSKTPDARFASAPEMINALELAIQGAMAAPAETWEAVIEEPVATTQWHRTVTQAHTQPSPPPVLSFLRRCIDAAFVMLASTGRTGNASDPHFLNRHHDINFPLS
ncbi:MAG: serine/threonine protein kinase [Bradymonadaceae bacterium]|nr:serine/threonine protein kinase [Lujinxingiaceae bacterium]